SGNDAQHANVNGADDAADLARLRTVPMPDLAANATGRIEVVSGVSRTRLHIKRAGKWSLVLPGQKLTAAELRDGVELGIEGRDIIRDRAVWDGRAVVRLSVTSDGRTTSDDVTLRLAPLLTHHHVQQTQQVLVTKVKGTDPGSRAQQKFVSDLAEHTKAANLPAPRTLDGGSYNDIWTQDFFEPGYTSMTGPGGQRQTLRIMIRSVQSSWRDAGREVFTKLRGPGTGAVQLAEAADGGGTLDSMGNLETIPPYTHNGQSFPAGRIIQGQFPATGEKPAKSLRTMLASQGMQSPLLLDTGWLHVGHVDEFVQFLPADTPRGWRMAVADPEAGLQLLKDAKAAGHGGKRLFSRPGGTHPVPKDTIDQTLASSRHAEDNALAARKIAESVEILKRETGVTDAEIVKVPALYSRASKWPGVSATDGSRLSRTGSPDAFMDIRGKAPAKSGAKARSSAAAPEPTSAWIPGAINGLLLNDNRYVAPKQWGPVIDGKDIFTTAVTSAYEKAGMKISYIDDYYPYHLGSGEVHCGTNTLRDASAAWWGR
ncbi:protein-arginine deiminase domain-containing protein, partial [Streptomyces sp. NPDC058953]|uniref:protein-arginine deiminase domain-containing protein n=1 Tax=Streptomyces sp. NPDC058953 TaxID=3346676 RepID=UPI0036A8A225